MWHAPGLVPGARIKGGQTLVRIDPRDYQLRVEQHRATLESQRLALAQEHARQDVARWEWSTYQSRRAGEPGSGSRPPKGAQEAVENMALRVPHLKSARANVRSAESLLTIAELTLRRTRVKSPFNAVVVAESVERGQVVSAGTSLLTLAGTDEFWVQASVPLSRLPLVRARDGDSAGAVARVRLGRDRWRVERVGEVIQILGDLDDAGRMARLLIEVPDPLGLNRASHDDNSRPLLLGSYVDVEIGGPTVDGVCELPERAVNHDGSVWLLTADNTLERRPVDVVWRSGGAVIVGGLEEGSVVVVSPPAGAVNGMRVRRASAPLSARSGR